MEQAVYLCSWSQSPEGYTLWLASRPEVTASGATYDEAESRLIEAIQSTGGATHPVLEFDPPLPQSAMDAKYTDPELYLITADDCFETDVVRRKPFETPAELDDRLKEIDAYYLSPVCRKCKYASSPRSEKPLSLTYTPREYDGAFGTIGSESGSSIQLLSEEFLNLLSPRELRALALRPAKRRSLTRTFYELLGPTGPPFVAVAGLTVKGWRCTLCNHRTWGYWVDGLHINSFIAESDLPASRPLSGIFTVGVPPEVHLVVAAQRWQELVGRKGTRGFTSNLLGVVKDREVVRCPELPELDGN